MLANLPQILLVQGRRGVLPMVCRWLPFYEFSYLYGDEGDFAPPLCSKNTYDYKKFDIFTLLFNFAKLK